MTTLWEKQRIDDLQTEEARQHNRQIRERYLRLQNAEETQLSETFEGAEAAEAAKSVKSAREEYAPAFVSPEANAQVKSVPLTDQQKELFSAETFRRVVSGGAAQQSAAAYVDEAAPVRDFSAQTEERSVEKAAAAVAQEETYSLTSAAKAVIAAFAALVVLMLTVIGINTRIMGAKGAELIALETQRAELLEESRALAERIEAETGDEAIERWAAQNGWVKQN